MNKFVPVYEDFVNEQTKVLSNKEIDDLVEKIFKEIKTKSPESIKMWIDDSSGKGEEDYKKILQSLVSKITDVKEVEKIKKYMVKEDVNEGIIGNLFKSKLGKVAIAGTAASLIYKAVKTKKKEDLFNLFNIKDGEVVDGENGGYEEMLNKLLSNLTTEKGLNKILKYLS